MGSKLEKGLEGKKKKRFGAQISHQVSKSQTHFSHLLLPYRVGEAKKKKNKRHRSDTGVRRVIPVSCPTHVGQQYFAKNSVSVQPRINFKMRTRVHILSLINKN